MKKVIGDTTIEVVKGDITEQDVEAIVNAANTTLLGGGGVDGAIHRAGGPEILRECEKLGGCATGDAKITTGGKLPARHVIHAVGPVYKDGQHGEPELLGSCYRRSLEIAHEKGLHSIAFPAISCGVYHYPLEEAAKVALDSVKATLGEHPVSLVRFVLFTEDVYNAFAGALDRLE